MPLGDFERLWQNAPLIPILDGHNALTDPTPSTETLQAIIRQLATELDARPAQIQAAVQLLDSGATVPFIARYRKEVTGGLDDTVLRQLETRLAYLRELEERRAAVLGSIAAQGKLDHALRVRIEAADSKQRLEDLYAPYKPKRRTRGQIAIEAGLLPLAEQLLAHPEANPDTLAAHHLNADAGFGDARLALNGARDILAERFADDAELVQALRKTLRDTGMLNARVIEGKEMEGAKFRDWFNYSESLRNIPSHRMLALLRGRHEGLLALHISLPPDHEALQPHPCVRLIADAMTPGVGFDHRDDARQHWLGEVCRWTWRVKLLPRFETEFLGALREQAEIEAIHVFAANLKDLLLSAPAGPHNVLGLDPGIRTGVKVAAIDATGKLLDTATIHPFAPRKDVEGSLRTLAQLITRHAISLVAIGNGTASRETMQLVRQLQAQHPGHAFRPVVVSEAGASVYSASTLAAEEFPQLDVSLRGAVSIARRLQDPLAELVKIEPKAIGVGQYQHDVNPHELARSLATVVEDCVNAVGVDVNTASVPLLTRVSGLNAGLARQIVQHRERHGAFRNRQALRDVPRLGDKTFEQAAGFLRIPGSDNPLDASAVHPEAYPVVEHILRRLKQPLNAVMGRTDALKGLSPADFANERFGLPTVSDIFEELRKPGRDPRPEFRTAAFAEGIQDIRDVMPGMLLEGVVSNVANFGAFVDIGVHQDGLVHVSALADHYVKDPRDVVRVGQTVQVRVVAVDIARQRISLSMRKDGDDVRETASPGAPAGAAAPARRAGGRRTMPPRPAAAQSAMAQAFARGRQKDRRP
ncbi:MAG: Tex family protein [Castellaniella sp.]